MSSHDRKRQEILARIDQLLQEAYTLPRTTESWERRLHIDWELFQLFRRLAGLDDGETPPAEEDEQEENDARKPHRLDRLAYLLF